MLFLCLGIDGEPGFIGTKGLKGEWGLIGKKTMKIFQNN